MATVDQSVTGYNTTTCTGRFRLAGTERPRSNVRSFGRRSVPGRRRRLSGNSRKDGQRRRSDHGRGGSDRGRIERHGGRLET